MGLCFETSRWLDRLWAEHLEMSAASRDLVQAGIKKQGSLFAGFPSDLHARLYLPTDPQEKGKGPDWASRLHTLATELTEWHRLKAMCARNGFAAGVATEALLSELLPYVPDGPKEPQHREREGDNKNPTKKSAKALQEPKQEAESSTPSPSDAALRTSLRRAARKAKEAVNKAETELEGLQTSLGFSFPGKSETRDSGPASLKAIREAHTCLSKSSRLKRIAELAGRLERTAINKARSKIRPGVGEVHGIECGGELGRLLPSELSSLRHSRLRLLCLSRLLQRQALSYGMTGREPLSRGPIVVLLDESSSMREHARDIWSKAVCLALLSTATRQKRSWHLVAFNTTIRREIAISRGKATTEKIQEALDHRCSGGTDFDSPVLRAVNIIRTSQIMRQADVVIITDGQDALSQKTIDKANALTKTEGVSWYVIGVGPTACDCISSLGPIATSVVRVRQTDETALVVPIINLEPTI